MSPIAPSDAAVLSPLADSFSLYSPSPSPLGSYSPVPATRMLKTLSTADPSDPEPRCFPTHQVFNFPEQANPLAPIQQRPCISIDPSLVTAVKRAASPAPSLTKKPRISGERINTKDFVPPDVSGLSKREARLVKNRAAAFLSRQRKREEFETMEMQVFSIFLPHKLITIFMQSRCRTRARECKTSLSHPDWQHFEHARLGFRSREP